MKQTTQESTKLICLTPVVNEAFELERFLQTASTWADHIIIGYQPSIDDTLKIAETFEKVIIVNSPGSDWNELAMRTLLYEEARKIEADKRIIFNLDADEIISANFAQSPEWQSILDLPPGSIVRMQWFNLKAGVFEGFDSNKIDVAFVDDGVSGLSGSIMHMGRVPWPNYDITILQCSEIRLLHYAFTNFERNLSKKTWYQAYEKVGKSEFGPHIFRKYNRSGRAAAPITSAKSSWFTWYSEHGIDVTSINYAYDYSHDYRLLEYLEEYGTDYFRMCNIWHKDWIQFATGKKDHPERFADPRTKMDRFVHRYIWWSIYTQMNTPKKIIIKFADRLLKLFGYSSR